MSQADRSCYIVAYHLQCLTSSAIWLANTATLFDEFKTSVVASPTGDELKGLDARFAERLNISASYWSQLKSRNRHIGETLARQFEANCGKPQGWLDLEQPALQGHKTAPMPATADERFPVQMLLTCYRLNPTGVKQRLLELMEGELSKVQHRKRKSANGA